MIRYLSLLLIFTFCYAEENVVLVRAKQGLKSVYISQFIKNDSPLSNEYLEQLHNLLTFDFTHNGYSEIKDSSSSIESVIAHKPTQLSSLDLARHIIRLELDQFELKPSLFTRNVSMGQTLDPISLSGQLESDAEKIHRLADLLHYKMYNIPGVASLKIVFAKDNDIWVKHFDTLEEERVTYENAHAACPIFIPNTHEVIYTSYKNGQPKLFHTFLNQSKGTPYVRLRGNQLLPSISPYANFLAFISDANGRPDLFIQRIDHQRRAKGSAQQIYTHPTATQSSSAFSPDGSSLVFVSDQSNTPRIYLIDLTETLKTRKLPQIECITHKNRENTSPSWSPDGNKIAYSAKTDGIRQIWIYDIASNEEIQLTNGPEDKENPAWAPNSLHLTYNTTSPKFDLYVVNLNNPTPVQITSGQGIKHFPSWEQKKLRNAL